MPFGSFSVGPYTFTPNLILAPMSGVTNSAFRRLIREQNPGAVGLVVTEFVSIEGLTRGSDRSKRMIAFQEIERPISIQIFGYDLDRMADAAEMAQDAGADIVDINSGCPVPKVVKRGGGCELMRQPEHLGKMLAAVKKRLRVPLTLKIRSGWDDKSLNAPEIARIAEDAGVSMLTVHGRTRQALYRGEADWNVVDAAAAAVSIPVVGSGDVVDIESAKRRFAGSAAALMIGRGALMNPWIFGDIARAVGSTDFDELSRVELAEVSGDPAAVRAPAAVPKVMKRYLELLLEDCSERAAIGKMKQFASQIVRGASGSTEIRRVLCTCSSLTQFSSYLDGWIEKLETGRYPRAMEEAISSQLHFQERFVRPEAPLGAAAELAG